MKQNFHSPTRLSEGVIARLSYFVRSFILFILLFAGLEMAAQPCVMKCKPGPIQLTLDGGCSKLIDPNSLLDLPQTTCTGSKTGIAFNGGGNPIGNVITSTFLGQTLNVTVLDIDSGQSCMTSISVVDTTKPILICQSDITISCNKSFAVPDLPAPIVIDNCGGSVSLTNTDVIIDSLCPKPATVFRTWKAVDASGNSKTCITKITLARPKLTDVEFVFATNFIIPCSQNPEDLNFMGQPTISGNPIDFNDLCDFEAIKTDSIAPAVAPLTGTTYFRTWAVSDLCLDTTITALQVFTVPDETAPTIVCPADVTFEATQFFCPNPISLPPPASITDDCVALPPLTVNWAFPDMGLGPYSNLPSGVYDVEYVVSDFAQNTAVCNFKVTIIDTIAPVAVCKGQVVVALSNIAPGILLPSSVEDGSHDNCTIIKYELDRLDDAEGFRDSLLFDCADIGDTIEIALKVTDPSGLFSICTSSVVVQDKLAPQLICPPDVTVECSDMFGDFTQYGNVGIIEPCVDTVIINIINQQDNCQVGSILREFHVTDIAGNSATCTQTITVVNSHPFDGNKIIWPKNYTSYDCVLPENFDPDKLPDTFNFPILPKDDPCALIATSHEDHVFAVSMPSCYKILRTWRVMDWCQFDPSKDSVGIWTHTQMIIVQDTVPPVISCVDTIKANVGPDCKSGFVTFPKITATDCSPTIKITNNSKYALNNGEDASGTYPIGTTNVMFTVSDLCGNFSFCTVKVIVDDFKAPGIICKNGLAADLISMGTPETMACIPAKAFDAATKDNCSSKNSLKFSYSADIADSTRCFTCKDLGVNYIKIWVTDLKGNKDYCETFIDIQDNMFPCPNSIQGDTASIAGIIVNETGQQIKEVKVDMNGYMNQYVMSDEKGKFNFNSLPMAQSYTIKPEKNTNPLNGVTTIDLIKLQRHIMGQEYLNTPYKLIAADLDGTKKITNNDLFLLKKLILHQISVLPGQPSWKFVKKSYTFPDPNNPWQEDYPEYFKDDHLMLSNAGVDFIGIKLGDLNGSASTTAFAGNLTRSNAPSLEIMIEDAEIKAGESTDVILRMNKSKNLQSCQFTLELAEGIYVDKIVAESNGKNNEDIVNYDESTGRIHYSWYELQGKHFEPNEALLKMRLRSEKAGRLSSFIKMSEADNIPEALNDMNEILVPELKIYEKDQLDSGFALFQNNPNPFSNQTTIRFRLAESGKARLKVMDATGKTFIEKQLQLPEGYHEIYLDAKELNGPGLYMYSLETEKQKAVARMILIK